MREYYLIINEEIKRNVKLAFEIDKSYRHSLIEKGLTYGEDNQPIPVNITPLVITDSMKVEIAFSSEMMNNILNKTISTLLEHSTLYSDYFYMNDTLNEWIQFENRFGNELYFSRIDGIITHDNEIKYIDFNTDYFDYITYCETMSRIYRENLFFNEMIAPVRLKYETNLIHGFVNGIFDYMEDIKIRSSNINIGLLYFDNSLTKHEGQIIKQFFVPYGYEVDIVDPRDFKLKNDSLTCYGKKYDLLIRQVGLKELYTNREECSDLLEGYFNGLIPMINPLTSSLGNEFWLFAFISHEKHHHLYEEDEVKMIRKYIPWTRVLTSRWTQDKFGDEIELTSYIIENKDKLVLKSTKSKKDYDVFFGENMSEEMWKSVVVNAIGKPDWIVQERVVPRMIECPAVVSGEVEIQNYYNTFSAYIIKNIYRGSLAKLSTESVIKNINKIKFAPIAVA